MTLFMTLAIIVGYFTAGLSLGIRDAPRFMAQNREDYTYLYGRHAPDKRKAAIKLRREAAGWAIIWSWLWPVMGPWFLVVHAITPAIERRDPQLKDERIAALKARTWELEDELGRKRSEFDY